MSFNVSGLDKTAIRLQAKALRKTLDIAAISTAICAVIETLPAFKDNHTVMAFYPLPGEIDLRPLMNNYPEKQWFLPRVQNDQHMQFLRYQIQDELYPSVFGVMEPSPNAMPVESTSTGLLLVPGLVFDRQGHRLGYGKGYYDRFLAEAPSGKLARAGVVANALLVEGLLPVDTLDIAVGSVITESGLLSL